MEEVTQSAIPEAAPATEGTEAANGATQIDGEASQGATDQTFIPQDVDVNTLSPEVKAQVEKINKDMLRGFTKKTQELAEERKRYSDYDQIREEADVYRQLSQDPDFVNYWQQRQSQQQPDELTQLKQEQAEIKKKQLIIDANNLIDSFQNAVDKEGNKLRPDFGDLDKLGLIQQFLNTTQEKSPDKWPKALESAYRSARQLYSEIYSRGKNAGMGIVQKKVAQSVEKPTAGSEVPYSGPDPKNLSASDAVALARKGEKVPRNW